jgi:hypothetical protein
VSLLEITYAERAGWQYRAATELVHILDAHRGLPVIGWTIGSAGSSLVGHVHESGTAETRCAFEAWRAALMLTEHPAVASGGAVYLRATTRRNRVRVGVTATVFNDFDEAVGRERP